MIESLLCLALETPDNAPCRELNAAVRQELKANGTLALQDHQFAVLVQRQDMTGAERSWANRKILYTTTAAVGAPASDRLAGGLCPVQTTVSGLPENRYCVFGS
jgi:hypothetical protein